MQRKISALFVLRIGLGINMLMHGLVRIPKLSSFADKMAEGFSQTLLPDVLVRSFLLVLPLAEFAAGVLILWGGRWTRLGFVAGSFILAALLFGTTLKEDWGTAGSQLVYVIGFAFGIYLYDKDLHPEKTVQN